MKIKTLELFGGIGSPRKELENLGLDIKHIDYVEWWKHPVEAYNRIFDNNYKAQDIKEWNLNVDMLIHGSPCQDFSVAGKNDLSSGRSILYRRTLEIIKKELNPRPKVVIWENVKGLISKKNFPHFQHYLDTMKSYGYKNHYKILNSKDFGISQSRNRVFVISILKGQDKFNNNFSFENLEITEYKPLKEFLEPTKEIGKEYYITQKSMSKAIEEGKVKIIDNVVDTILTKQVRWNNQGVLKIPLTTFNQENYVHNLDKAIAPTLTAGRANSRIKIAIPLLEIETKDFINFKTISRTIDGELVKRSHNRIWKEDKYVGTIAALSNTKIKVEAIEPIPNVPIFIIEGKPYHLRILTQREAWRLMGWDDKSIDKVIDMPKTHMYHMAGNAIVIQVLEAIFKELINIKR
ncbi:DNA (cytosine-5-)-methyltransferase [Spiroplasma endosymbiont of Atherix ibis]|uniref:DNA cytosine methyltransferase n=1 Tax=Spiroplasma endosymbiont of Atherix ibis TaxID=3066291 RepID=UPI0030D17580